METPEFKAAKARVDVRSEVLKKIFNKYLSSTFVKEITNYSVEMDQHGLTEYCVFALENGIELRIPLY